MNEWMNDYNTMHWINNYNTMQSLWMNEYNTMHSFLMIE